MELFPLPPFLLAPSSGPRCISSRHEWRTPLHCWWAAAVINRANLFSLLLLQDRCILATLRSKSYLTLIHSTLPTELPGQIGTQAPCNTTRQRQTLLCDILVPIKVCFPLKIHTVEAMRHAVIDTCWSMEAGRSVRGGLGGAASLCRAPRGMIESSLTGTIGGRSPSGVT